MDSAAAAAAAANKPAEAPAKPPLSPSHFKVPVLGRKGWWRSIVGCGAYSFVTTTDRITALKSHQVWEDGRCRAEHEDDCEESLAREARVYALLGNHPHILTCSGLEVIHDGPDKDVYEGIYKRVYKRAHALRIEFAPGGNLRSFIRDTRADGIVPSLACRLRLARDVADAIAHIHHCGVRHCDLTCRNLFLAGDITDSDAWIIKLGDFGGAVIESEVPDGTYVNYVYEEQAYDLPLRGRAHYSDRPPRKRELFALGSAIYELVAWCKPYEGLSEDEIEAKHNAEEMPPLDDGDVAVVAGIVRACWAEQYENADTIVEALDRLLADELKQTQPDNTNDAESSGTDRLPN
ncbi:hypothetical protein SCUCBS95973_004107 [Sporothrix curviconia]|uniref:EKC/KEOPS complex subunit BUD32 n=1 Tax=Sporothrix curviconia TaxID=1260050 RepID=A0ABP0BKX2_9PEZI